MHLINKKFCFEFIIACIFSFYIYNANYIFLPIGTSKIIWLLSVLGLVYFVINPKTNNISLKDFRLFIFRFFPLFIFGIIILIISIFFQAKGLTLPFYIILYYLDLLPTSIFLIMLLSRLKIGIEHTINIIILIGIIQALMMFSMMIIPAWKTVYSLITINNDFIRDYYSYRYIGITGFANYTVGTTQAIIFIVCFLDSIENKKFNLSRLFSLLLLASSALFASRSSLIILIPCLIILFLFNLKSRFFIYRIIPKLSIIFIIVFLAVLYLLFDEQLLKESPVIKWALEPITNFIDTGEFTTKSSDSISNFYFMPNNYTFLWGDWAYTNDDGSYYMQNDAGYMRVLLFMGIYLSCIFYFIFICCWLYSIFTIKKSQKYKNTFITLISVLFILFALQYKGNIFIDGIGMMKVMLILLLSKYICFSKLIATSNQNRKII